MEEIVYTMDFDSFVLHLHLKINFTVIGLHILEHKNNFFYFTYILHLVVIKLKEAYKMTIFFLNDAT